MGWLCGQLTLDPMDWRLVNLESFLRNYKKLANDPAAVCSLNLETVCDQWYYEPKVLVIIISAERIVVFLST